MQELEELVNDKARLSRLLLTHLVNRSLYSAGLRSHQKMEMANGRHVNMFARKGMLKLFTTIYCILDVSMQDQHILIFILIHYTTRLDKN